MLSHSHSHSSLQFTSHKAAQHGVKNQKKIIPDLKVPVTRRGRHATEICTKKIAPNVKLLYNCHSYVGTLIHSSLSWTTAVSLRAFRIMHLLLRVCHHQVVGEDGEHNVEVFPWKSRLKVWNTAEETVKPQTDVHSGADTHGTSSRREELVLQSFNHSLTEGLRIICLPS